MTPCFTHCASHVADLDRSIEFYRDYCGLKIVKEHGEGSGRTVWLASPGREQDFVLVLLGGGPRHAQEEADMTHYGFAVGAREDIDRIAARGREEGCLHWEPREYAPPTGYLCAVKDPSGYVIEFSYGQPLGPQSSNKPASR
jgi:catechol 2,3-dioxygenase-like lactoylglutathione lyase family enzyme